jgi:hypothetical protein
MLTFYAVEVTVTAVVNPEALDEATGREAAARALRIAADKIEAGEAPGLIRDPAGRLMGDWDTPGFIFTDHDASEAED